MNFNSKKLRYFRLSLRRAAKAVFRLQSFPEFPRTE